MLNQRNSRLQNCKLLAPCVFGLSEQLRGFEVSGYKLRPAPGTLVTLDLASSRPQTETQCNMQRFCVGGFRDAQYRKR